MAHPSSPFLEQMIYVLPFVIALKILIFWVSGIYKGMYRYSSLSDLWKLSRANLFSTLIIIFTLLVFSGFKGFSRAVFIIDGVLSFLLTGGVRVGIRTAYQEGFLGRKEEHPRFVPWKKRKGRPVFIVGAGNAGEKTFREISDNPLLPYLVVGFFDDDPEKLGKSIHGVPILGGIDQLKRSAEIKGVEEVLIAIPTASGRQMRKIVENCEAAGLRFRTLPGLGELINGKVSVKALRDVNFQDLLGRPSVDLDQEGIAGYLKDKCVLVTGAGGSIGSELCRQIVRFDPERLVLYEANEANLYGIQMELKQRMPYGKFVTVLGAIQNQALVDRVFAKYSPSVVFHAAAYKHVPMLEENPWQAVANNILGSQRIMEA